ncbi:MAG: molybdopterin-dependent oxidoreductase [Bacillota bacterium]
MASLIDNVNKLNLSRRAFLKATTIATAGLSLTGCGNSLKQSTANNAEKEGKWISASCWHNCGGRCCNKAYVVDGVVIRQKTDDTHPDTPNYPQQRACIRGKAQQQQVFGTDRLKYPMKRKNWAPGGGKKELRGRDEWVRISWDEALDIVASELKSAKEKYGNRSIFECSFSGFSTGHDIGKVLGNFGGCVSSSGTRSWGTWKITPDYIGRPPDAMSGLTINDRFDLLNAETVIIWGANPAWSSMGLVCNYARRIKEAGAKFIAVDSFYNETAALVEAEWIPCRPAADTAAMLGIAYAMITMDDPINNPIIDWEFLKNHTIGFDAENMPEDANPRDNFKDYVLGTYDGHPKTPEWASKICGISPNNLRYLALELRKGRKTCFMNGWAPARNRNADNLPQLIYTLGAMGGHIGKSGHSAGLCCTRIAFNGGPPLVRGGGAGLPGAANPVDDSFINSIMWDAILDGKYNYAGNLDTKVIVKGEQRNIDIRVIYAGAVGNNLQTREGTNKGIEAYRKVDFAVTHAYILNAQAQYADVVLPITTEWERVGDVVGGAREAMFIYSQVTEPLYEAQSDQWIAYELAKRLGLNADTIFPIDAKQQFFNKLAGSTVVTPDGKGYETLITITAGDIAQWGVTGKPQKGRISLQEIIDRGFYQVERRPGDNLGYIAFKDPASIGTGQQGFLETSKFLIYSKELEDTISGMGFSKIKAIPTYIKPVGGYEDTFKDWEKQIKGEFPFQIHSLHYPRRVHATMDSATWLQEAWPNPVFMNEDDANKLNIYDGDTVLITSPHGRTLRHAHVTQRFIPGVIGLPHGSWLEMDEGTGIDLGGCGNIICGAVPTGQGTSGWNTEICRIEKYTGKAIIPDVEKPRRVIFGEGGR